MWTFAALVISLVSLAILPPAARACATCAVGDPTLTTMGTQQPNAGRLRASLEAQMRSDAVGQAGVDRVELTEQRLSAALSYAPVDWAMFSVTLPVLFRQVTEANLSESSVVGLGDMVLRGKWFIYRDSAFAPEHLLSLVTGLKMPTGKVERGDAMAPELQAGTGSFDPILGLSYAFFGGDWSVFISEVVYIPLPSPEPFRMGTSWRGTHALQYQFIDQLAARLSVNTRLDAVTWLENPSRREPDSGGFIAYVAPAAVVSPLSDLVVYLELQIPVLNALVGTHDEGLLAMLGVAYDL